MGPWALEAAIAADMLARGLFWPGMRDEAQELVSGCMDCQRHNIHKFGYQPLSSAAAAQPIM